MNLRQTIGWLGALLLVMSGAGSGARAEAASEVPSAWVGIYDLITVDGQAMPATITHGPSRLEVRGGTFTLQADGTCGTRTIFVPPNGMELIRDARATYIVEGTKLTMRWERAGVTKGTIAGDTFTLHNEGMLFVYKKRVG